MRSTWACCALIVAWLAVTRWNGVPADAGGQFSAQLPSQVPIDPADDRTQALLAALQSLPPEPTWTLPPPPPGMRWTGSPSGPIDPGEVLDGHWTPETRPHMQAVIAHLQAPSVEVALARIAALVPGGCRVPSQRTTHMSDIRRACRLLVARARYYHAGLGDVDAAIQDLGAALRLAGIVCRGADHLLQLTGVACESLVHDELRSMSFERRISARQADVFANMVRSFVPTQNELWDDVAVAETDALRRALDLSFTQDGNGNGWLVLSRFDNIVYPAPATRPRLGAWNLLSPLFNNRRTVSVKIDRVVHALREIQGMPFAEAQDRLGELETRAPLNILDGPIWRSSTMQTIRSRNRWHVSLVANRRATILAVALSAHRSAHGTYPTSLSELVGKYLDLIPEDPYDGLPFRYIPRLEQDDYVIYCVGPNLRDDGGRRSEWKPGGGPRTDDGDVVFGHERRDHLYSEIGLEKAAP